MSRKRKAKMSKSASVRTRPKTKGTTTSKPSPALGQCFRRVYRQLGKLYPDAKCALNHRNAFELMVSTILSAQCTDVRVNMVTPMLFKSYPDAGAMAKAPLPKIERLIRTTGFFRNKAKFLKGASQVIVEKRQGQVPDRMDELLELPGVARKTANVILGNAFGKDEGVVVDTHVARLSQRLGFTKKKTPDKIERDMMAICPRKDWTMLAHLLIFHGRQVCTARKPACDQCKLAKDCPKLGVPNAAERRE